MVRQGVKRIPIVQIGVSAGARRGEIKADWHWNLTTPSALRYIKYIHYPIGDHFNWFLLFSIVYLWLLILRIDMRNDICKLNMKSFLWLINLLEIYINLFPVLDSLCIDKAFYLYCFFKTTFLHFTNILIIINLLKGQQSHIIAKQTCIIVHSVGTY